MNTDRQTIAEYLTIANEAINGATLRHDRDRKTLECRACGALEQIPSNDGLVTMHHNDGCAAHDALKAIQMVSAVILGGR